MNTEIFKQTLIESFETLKDSWVGNEDILATCVVEVSKYDSDLALDMWLYLLNANTNILLSSYKAPEITTDIMYKWHSKNSNSGNYFLDECKTVNESFLPFIDRHEDILNMWFGNTINAGFGGTHKEFSPIILACLLLSKSPKIVSSVLQHLVNNSNMQDVSIGKLLAEVQVYFRLIIRNDLDRLYRLDASTKEVLVSVSSWSCNPMKRAELSIGLLSLIADNDEQLEKDKEIEFLIKRNADLNRQIEELEKKIKIIEDKK